VISPGPCKKTPQEAGISVEMVQKLAGKIPILGVCLGHQAIGAAFGGKICPRAQAVFNGKTSQIRHDGQRSISRPAESFYRDALSLADRRKKNRCPPDLQVTAETDDDIIMGMQHKQYPLMGRPVPPGIRADGFRQAVAEEFPFPLIAFSRPHSGPPEGGRYEENRFVPRSAILGRI